MSELEHGRRRRSFCRYCGALTSYLDRCCGAHRDLLARERVPADPLSSLPTMAQEQAARMGDETIPTKGTEA